MRFKIKLKDKRPMIGIFEIVDDEVLLDIEEADFSKAVNGVIDGGHLFHRDLIRYYKDDPNISKETREFINNNLRNPNLHEAFPRGRICYNLDTGHYEVYSTEEVLKDNALMNEILRRCGIPGNKVEAFVDNFHYQLKKRDEI